MIWLALLAPLFVVRLMRKLGPVPRWTEAGVRPWACNLCMAGWSSPLALPALVGHPWQLAGACDVAGGALFVVLVSAELALRLAAAAAATLLLLELGEAIAPGPLVMPPDGPDV